ncbi:hypothetical protein ABZ345_21465 [Lentzea sp. NPDC005914]|uniref:hypothetical protein n=1 Tax=Lentzea sp. NPDC005914 TaxID=3154572 RepID=UPI00340DAA1C
METDRDRLLHRGGKQNLPLLMGIEQVEFFHDVMVREVTDAVQAVDAFAMSLA